MIDITTVPLVFLDVETTGFSARTNRMTEVAAIRMEGGKITGQLQTFLKIDEPVPEEITSITGITDKDLEHAPLFGTVAPMLMALFSNDAIMVAHNAKFDKSFLEAEFDRTGWHFDSPTLCTKELAQKYYPEMINHKLETLIQQHGYTYDARHRAYDDAAVLIQFRDKLVTDFGIERLQTEAVWLTKGLAG
jgi:DNA polymerase-3 subunit epsilon